MSRLFVSYGCVVCFFQEFVYNEAVKAVAYPGVAQLVGRLVWELEHLLPRRKEPTRKPVAALALFLLDFSPALV